MSFLRTIQLTNLEFGLILVALVLVTVLILSRRKEVPSTEKEGYAIEFEGLKEWVKESESICETLSENLEERRRIAKRLVAQLDGKIEEMNELLNKLNKKELPAAQEGKSKDVHSLITKMADYGFPASQIARRLKISEGEVQLVLDLRKFGRRKDLPYQVGASRM